MTMDTMSPAEKKHWETILIESGLSIWRGAEHLIYISKDTVLDWIAEWRPWRRQDTTLRNRQPY